MLKLSQYGSNFFLDFIYWHGQGKKIVWQAVITSTYIQNVECMYQVLCDPIQLSAVNFNLRLI